ncbi:neuromedin-U [Lampris incognitus]|uniref:neuromedin-U n=1 Tax=Lampris incognitus TaxID=2546036 RepID=UPI0024B5444B|nr:neuromedin-U [Lampris incognitus]
MKRTSQGQTHLLPPQRGGSAAATTPLSTASLVLTLLILALPICKSAPAQLQHPTTDQHRLLSQIDDVCASYLSADLPFPASGDLGKLCVLMLVQKSKELRVRENRKRTSAVLHPLLQLVPQLRTRRERRVSVRDDLQGPGGIQSRGYFLYRPRNGRRSLDYE